MEITDEAVSKVMPIFSMSISSKAIDGVNWALVLDSNKELINEYEVIRNKIKEAGYIRGEVLRVFEAPNGYIYDIDARVIKKLVCQAMEGDEAEKDAKALISTAYELRRNAEFVKLQMFLVKAFRSGKTKVSIALFNTNMGNKIKYKTKVMSGEYSGKTVEVSLDAFALRHWDLQELNQNYLIPAKIKIKRVQVVEILPTRTGVGFNIELVGLEE